MMTRVILTLLFNFYLSIVMINPNTGKEMGKQEGDVVNSYGNSISGTRMKINHTVLMLVLQISSIWYKLNIPVNILDIFLFIISTVGLGISYWAYYTMGNLYTFTLGIRKEHKIVRDGPYNYFVHPGYLGQFCIILGSILFYRVNYVFTVLLACYIGYQFNKRIVAEEEMLRDRFGAEYTGFVNNRYRLVPYVY